MVHIFVINPKAGQGKAPLIEKSIEEEAAKRGLVFAYDKNGKCDDAGHANVIIYETDSEDAGERYVKYVCRSIKSLISDTFRFYAVGGDGTLHQVVNGCVGFDGVEVGQIPMGTGNDFVRSLPGGHDFTDIGAQMDGVTFPCDLIKYEGMNNGSLVQRYAVNMFNIGLDCNVVDLTGKVKKLPFVMGSFAYYLSVLIMFIEKKGAELRIEFENGEVYDGKLLLVAIANGEFCGGGVKGVPKASVDDGRFDVSIVKGATRREFLHFFPLYKEGKHLDDEHARRLFEYHKSKSLVITPKNGEMKLCTDGEITMAGKMTFNIETEAINFVLPKN